MLVRSGGGRPRSYKTADGKRVPGVTTVLSRFKDSGGLIHWAWQCGIDGKDYRSVRDDAASAGTVCHDMIEAHIHGRPYERPRDVDEEIMVRAEKAFSGFVRWTEQTQMELLVTELPLVSERYRFGGTLDAIGRVHGRLAMVDWKSSNAVYGEYLAQVGAYVQLYEEHHPHASRIEEIHLLRVDKEHAGFHHHSWDRDVIDKGLRYFLLCREAYDLAATLKKAA